MHAANRQSGPPAGFRVRPRVAATVSLIAIGSACGGGVTPAAPPVTERSPAELARLHGDGQTGLAGVPLRDSLVVQVLDEDGAPMAGVAVEWTTNGGDGVVRPSRTTSDPDGRARALWVLGTGTGADTVRAALDSLEVSFSAVAASAEPGNTYEGRAGYVSYEGGSLPVILSAGHGGTLEPAEIPDRTEGTLVRDLNTDLLALAMADSIEARFGARPHLIQSHLHRRKLDPNRALAEAAQGNPLAEHAWREYHGLLDHARRVVEEDQGEGFYIDVHGHGHAILRLELGYLLSAAELARPDEELDDALATRSSIRGLAETSPLSFSDLIRGRTSLGTLFEDAGVPAVPGAEQPDPGDDPYFTGGYSTRRHGSRDGGSVSGVQIEAHREGLRDTAENRARFAGAAAAVLQQFLATHYGVAPE